MFNNSYSYTLISTACNASFFLYIMLKKLQSSAFLNHTIKECISHTIEVTPPLPPKATHYMPPPTTPPRLPHSYNLLQNLTTNEYIMDVNLKIQVDQAGSPVVDTVVAPGLRLPIPTCSAQAYELPTSKSCSIYVLAMPCSVQF